MKCEFCLNIGNGVFFFLINSLLVNFLMVDYNNF